MLSTRVDAQWDKLATVVGVVSLSHAARCAGLSVAAKTCTMWRVIWWIMYVGGEANLYVCRTAAVLTQTDKDVTWLVTWLFQCSLCVDNFLGSPTDGHQCYRQMTVEREHCFDPVTQMNCDPARDPNPLGLYRTVFFAVQPKYLNVDIRIILDVTGGGASSVYCYISIAHVTDSCV